MAYTTINKHTDHFNNKLWTGNGSTQYITGVNHTPDFVWIKKRTDADGARIFDTIRGATKGIFTNSTAAETTVATELSAFGSDGYTLGASDAVNGNTKQYVGWNWKAGGATGSSNSDGTITSTVSANTTAGFSIVSYTGNATSGATIGHGLGAVPKMIITKNRDQSSGSQDWCVYHVGMGGTKAMFLNLTNSPDTNAKYFNDTTPTSSVFTVGNNLGTNGSGDNMIAYCFAEKTGFSKIGSYTGNGSSDGTFVYTGFKPTFVLTKGNSSGENWFIHDGARNPSNPTNKYLRPNLNNAEGSYDHLDLLSNGFKSISAGSTNGNNVEQIYLAIGQSLVGSNNVPCTAR